MVASTAKDADLKLSKDEKQGAFSALVETADTVQALRELVPSTVAKPRAKSDASQQGKRTDLEKSKVNQPNLANELIEISERLEQLRENAKSVSESLAHAFNVIEDELHEWQELRWS
jgi:hypothetical protein